MGKARPELIRLRGEGAALKQVLGALDLQQRVDVDYAVSQLPALTSMAQDAPLSISVWVFLIESWLGPVADNSSIMALKRGIREIGVAVLRNRRAAADARTLASIFFQIMLVPEVLHAEGLAQLSEQTSAAIAARLAEQDPLFEVLSQLVCKFGGRYSSLFVGICELLLRSRPPA